MVLEMEYPNNSLHWLCMSKQCFVNLDTDRTFTSYLHSNKSNSITYVRSTVRDSSNDSMFNCLQQNRRSLQNTTSSLPHINLLHKVWYVCSTPSCFRFITQDGTYTGPRYSFIVSSTRDPRKIKPTIFVPPRTVQPRPLPNQPRIYLGDSHLSFWILQRKPFEVYLVSLPDKCLPPPWPNHQVSTLYHRSSRDGSSNLRPGTRDPSVTSKIRSPYYTSLKVNSFKWDL